ncbi:Trp biosynthesis-associated membrane protein [Saccharomonospora piscinae]|uniref:Trp biosynthesis-associated membrane protein n=1 Tax=Saccharomonospora piscinae TaxID=687388 RepID=UPI00046771D1|nr:Trp biosynthesis-associated membrane protein [Saccharomonospora piscinae]
MADSERRPLWIVVALLVLAAAGLWAASSLTWLDLPPGSGYEGELRESLTGGDLVPWPGPLALLALAAVAAALALRGVARRLLGVVLAAAAVWVTVLVLGGSAYEAYEAAPAVRAPGYDTLPGSPSRTWWGPAAALASAALLASAGVLLAWRGHRMPRMGAKYSAPGDERRRAAAPDPDADLWKALSEGKDPTERDR